MGMKKSPRIRLETYTYITKKYNNQNTGESFIIPIQGSINGPTVVAKAN